MVVGVAFPASATVVDSMGAAARMVGARRGDGRGSVDVEAELAGEEDAEEHGRVLTVGSSERDMNVALFGRRKQL